MESRWLWCRGSLMSLTLQANYPEGNRPNLITVPTDLQTNADSHLISQVTFGAHFRWLLTDFLLRMTMLTC
ncbi:hypothetical protein K443DRAFT_681434 [Laccaria amethystina LaAM-08-1]|uniref:Uncharacterized protein n=1 Tax=Laccaria amethystina LaAM-08-1 TaxID=1095629 RepID=A0A0C9WXS2_9AGAR|nr:hypothetical protein K443DRAFT_681434 [Laccaria amethystina LaAM-08-1]